MSGVLLPFLQVVLPDGGSVSIPQEITVSTADLVGKFAMMFLAVLAAGLLPWFLRKSQSSYLALFRLGALYALMPAVVAGSGLASLVTGISLTRMKFGSMADFWPLPVAIFGFILAGEALGGVIAVLSGAPRTRDSAT